MRMMVPCPPLIGAIVSLLIQCNIAVVNGISLSRSQSSSSNRQSSSGRGKDDFSNSPIKHFQESLAASTAHRTLIAISACIPSTSGSSNENEPCIVLLSHSSLHSNNDCENAIENDETIGDGGTEVSSTEIDKEDPLIEVGHGGDGNGHDGKNQGQRSSSSPFALLNNGQTVMGMTGFIPDVQHIMKCTSQTIQQYGYLYDLHGNEIEETVGRNGMPLHVLVVDHVAKQLSRASMANGGGRPFGVQALLVGPNSDTSRRNIMDVYSVDTSGGWNKWNSGITVIGRDATLLRQYLVEEMKTKGICGGSLLYKDALNMGLKCLLRLSFATNPSMEYEGDDEDESSNNNDTKSTSKSQMMEQLLGKRLDSVIIFRPLSQTSSLWTVKRSYLRQNCQTALQSILDEGKTKTNVNKI